MKTGRIRALLLWIPLTLATSCKDDPTSPGTELPDTFPSIPRPSSPNEVIPDESEIYVALVPIEDRKIDFAPSWTEGTFTWNVDIQTQYDKVIGGWDGDAPGDYWSGTAHTSDMTFQGGLVDLRNPTPFGPPMFPRRVLFVDQGVKLTTPRHPERDHVLFQFFGGHADRRFDGALFGGHWELAADPGVGEWERRRAYYVAAMSCSQIAAPVYIKRERFWKRLPMGGDGNNLKSIRVDPGASFSVTYTRTQGTETQASYTFTQALNAEVPIPYIGVKLGGSLSEAFQSQVTITEETSVEVQKSMTGKDGKTVIYSVWTSVERFSVCDANGEPYTDPNFTFSEMGNALIQSEYEWISSTEFDYQ